MFKKIIIANRGEIALRIQRACREMGIQTVMIYSQADRDAKYVRLAEEAVCIGPAPVSESYLNVAAILAAAEITESEAVHPGYGLLSENAEFAEQVQKSGFTFIGPTAETIRLMGDKIAAKQSVKKNGLKTVPGSDGALPADIKEASAMAAEVGFPLIIKASAGGGGRGMRLVHNAASLENIIPMLRRESLMAFGNDSLYAEKFLENPRHVEVQVLADGKDAVHLGTRDCSMQRRNQKIIEEAPAPNIPEKKLRAVCESCAAACRKMRYMGAGTFEFLYDGKEFYFIEMNTRIQVEHPATEMITGVDIVQEQLYIAAGEPLRMRQRDIVFSGHSIECRLNAEDPRTFVPSPGRINEYHTPGGAGVRVDSHAYRGYTVPPYYDSLLAKLIVCGSDRAHAIARMRSALGEYVIDGITTNLPLHADLLRDEKFIEGGIGIHYLEEKIKNME
ncbi:MAG: acetyl-CoA carboxylase biotin carboxylase subunit [Gammaproteobacteria bacterium WSBS_2016_MAG_OTU1]